MPGWDYSGRPYFAQLASSATPPIWGVDSATPPHVDLPDPDFPSKTVKFYDLVVRRTGRAPNFWGRYIGGLGHPEWNLTREEVAYLATKSCRILIVYNRLSDATVRTEVQGAQAADTARQLAAALGVDGGKKVRIYCNIEPTFTSVSRDFFRGWFNTLQDSEYLGGVYGDTEFATGDPPVVVFNREYCAAYQELSTTSMSDALLWTNRPNRSPCNILDRQVPFNPTHPSCTPRAIPRATTAIYQYSINCSLDPNPPPPNPTPPPEYDYKIDLDLANSLGFKSMWAPPLKVVFWKYNPSAVVTQLLYSESGAAWTPVDFGTASAGQTNHLGQQVAVLREKLLALGDSPLAIYETSNVTSFTKRYGTDLQAAPAFDGRLILRGTTPWAAWSPSNLGNQSKTVPGSRANVDDPYADHPLYLSGPFSWSGTQVGLPYTVAPDGSRANRRLDSQWAFTVPADVFIAGVEVTISTTFSGGPTSPTPNISVWLRVGGQWSPERSVLTYPEQKLGGPDDLWDFGSIAVSDINAPEFGVGIVGLQKPSEDGSSGTLTLTCGISVKVYYGVSPRVWEDGGGSYVLRYKPTRLGEIYLYHIADAFGTIWGTFTTILRKWIGGTTWSDVWTSTTTLDRSVYWPAQNRLMMARQKPGSGAGVGEILAFDGTTTPPPAVLPGITDRVGYMLVVGNDLYVMAVVTTNGITGDTWKIYRCTDLNTAVLIGQGTLSNTVIPALALVWHPPTSAFYAAIGSTTLQKIYKAISPVSDASPVPIGQLTFSEVYSASESALNHIRDGTVAYLR